MKEIGTYKKFSFSNFTELVKFLIGDGKGKINKNRFVTYKDNCYVYVGEADESDDEFMERTDGAKWELRLELYPGAAQEVDGCDDDYPNLSYYYEDGEPDDKAFATDYDITDFVGHEKVEISKKAETEAIIKAFKEAVKDGVDLRGYYPWGPIDIISCSSSEIEKRYGFIYVDYDNYGNGTGKRSLKDSYYWYQKVCASNGEDLGE